MYPGIHINDDLGAKSDLRNIWDNHNGKCYLGIEIVKTENQVAIIQKSYTKNIF